MEKWVKVLRSGRYKQGKDVLKCKTRAGVVRHCCLGVLCELYQKEHKVKLRTDTFCFVNELIFSFDGDTAGLPERVMRWSGVRTDGGSFRNDLLNDTLASINDGGDSFKEIADIIEEKYKVL